MKTKMKCEVCKKEFEYYPSEHPNRQFCSKKCRCKHEKKNKLGFWNSEVQSKLGKRGGKVSAKIRKEMRITFWNSEFQSKWGKVGGKISGKMMKEKKLGIFAMTKKQLRLAWEKGRRTQKKNKTGIYSFSKRKRSEMGKRGAETNKKNKTGFYDSEVQKKNSFKGKEAYRKNKPYLFNNIHFDSKAEMEVGVSIHYQIEKLKEGINYQVKVSSKLFDFFIKKYSLFIEYHPWDRKRTPEEYFRERREILNKNGYKNYPLMIIK